MAQNNNFSVKHVATLADLPKKLTLGRAYFVDDEHYIIVDHGAGPVIYGNRKGEQGNPGEPIPELQAQIDSLTEASIRQLHFLYEQNQRAKIKHDALQKNINSAISKSNSRSESLQEYISLVDKRRANNLAEILSQFEFISASVVNLAAVVSNIADNLHNTEQTILKLLLEDEQQNPITPISQNEIIETDSGYRWKISEIGSDGTLVFTLETSQPT